MDAYKLWKRARSVALGLFRRDAMTLEPTDTYDLVEDGEECWVCTNMEYHDVSVWPGTDEEDPICVCQACKAIVQSAMAEISRQKECVYALVEGVHTGMVFPESSRPLHSKTCQCCDTITESYQIWHKPGTSEGEVIVMAICDDCSSLLRRHPNPWIRNWLALNGERKSITWSWTKLSSGFAHDNLYKGEDPIVMTTRDVPPGLAYEVDFADVERRCLEGSPNVSVFMKESMPGPFANCNYQFQLANADATLRRKMTAMENQQEWEEFVRRLHWARNRALKTTAAYYERIGYGTHNWYTELREAFGLIEEQARKWFGLQSGKAE